MLESVRWSSNTPASSSKSRSRIGKRILASTRPTCSARIWRNFSGKAITRLSQHKLTAITWNFRLSRRSGKELSIVFSTPWGSSGTTADPRDPESRLTPGPSRARKSLEFLQTPNSQGKLLGSCPSLQLLLPLSSRSQVRMRLDVQDLPKSEDPSRSDAFPQLVLDCPSVRVVSDPDVQSAVAKFGDIDPAPDRLPWGHAFGCSPSTRARSRVVPSLRAFASGRYAEWLAMSEGREAARVEWLGR